MSAFVAAIASAGERPALKTTDLKGTTLDQGAVTKNTTGAGAEAGMQGLTPEQAAALMQQLKQAEERLKNNHEALDKLDKSIDQESSR